MLQCFDGECLIYQRVNSCFHPLVLLVASQKLDNRDKLLSFTGHSLDPV